MNSGTTGRKIKIPVLLGPTAAGKSEIALSIAQELGLSILSCDSRQVYRFMDIGTAKPSAEDRANVRHWMIDIVDPDEHYSSFRFANESAAIIRDRAGQGETVLVCGGSGLYFKSLSRGIGPQVEEDGELRRRFRDMARVEGPRAVFAELEKVDPLTASRSHAANVKRNIRALEVFFKTGIPFSTLITQARPPEDFDFFVIVLSRPREELYKRINDRVDAMVAAGLPDEFSRLRARGFGASSPGMLCVGYRELFAVEEKSMGLGQAVELIKKNSRNYAKRQITWFRHQVAGVTVTFDPHSRTRVQDLVKNHLLTP